MTARRMMSGLVLQYLNGSRFVMWKDYETALPRLKPSSSDRTDIHHDGQAQAPGAGIEPKKPGLPVRLVGRPVPPAPLNRVLSDNAKSGMPPVRFPLRDRSNQT